VVRIFNIGRTNLADPLQVSDFLVWMDWPGFINGTSNGSGIKYLTVPQANGGPDTYGNTIDQYKFETVEISGSSFTTSSTVQFVFTIPHVALASSTRTYSSIGFNYLSVPADAVANLAVVTNTKNYNLNYTGSNWTNTIYRAHSTYPGTFSRLIQPSDASNNFYFRGGNLI